MKKVAILFIVFSSLVFSQKGKYVDHGAVDGPGFTSGSQVIEKNYLPSILNKYKDPSITGGRISNVSKHWDFLTNNVDATSNPLGTPLDMALDAAGNLYISLSDLHVIRKVESNGSISTFAGNGNEAWAGDDGPAIDASFDSPHGLHFDTAGNLYIADRGNHIIRKIDTNGVITTVAGQGGYSGFSGDGGAATSAELNSPYDVAFDASGNLYVSEVRRIRKIDTNGIITTFAGDGGDDFSGDGGAATSAGLGNPAHMVLDQFGNLYFADYTHHVVRKIDTNGVMTLVYGVGGESGTYSDSPKKLYIPFGVAYEREKIDALGLDEDILYIIDYLNHCIVQIILRGKDNGEPESGNAYVEAEILWGKEATSGFDGDGDTNWDETARFDLPETMITNFTATSTGFTRIYHISDTKNQRVRQIVEGGVFTPQSDTRSMSTVAGTDIYNGTNIQANTARVYIPRNSAFGKDGNYYVADQGNHMIRKIDTNGVITTVAGNGTEGFDGDGGPATEAKINNPRGVTVDSKGNLYISDTANNRIRKVDTSGNISTLAGNGNAAYSGDGAASTSSEINFPYQITVDASDNIYFADKSNHVIRKIDVNGNISTVAGNNEGGYSGDGGQATNAQLAGPLGVAFDADGNLYIGDSGNHVIRKVDPNGIISTLAGTAQESGFVDGVTGTQARFYTPSTLAIDSKGNLYVTDSSNHRVRKITPDGAVSTIAGNGYRTYTADSVAATTSLSSPFGISIDQNDNIYLSDSWNFVIRKITPRKTTLKVPSEYATIQSAIDYAIKGDTVSVAAGSYKENINLNLKDIHIIGTNRETTIINGDAQGTVVTFNGDANGNMPDNAYVNTVLAGFTLENGNGTIIGEGTSGGGIEINGKVKPLLKDLIIEYNKALNGAGIKLYNSASPNIDNCIIRNNQTVYPDPSGKWSAGMGGGISADDYNGTIKNVVFSGNKSRQASIMNMDWGSANNFEIINCTFANNYGEYNDMYFSGPLTINITNSIIWDDSTVVRNSQWKSMYFSESNGTVTVNAKNSIIQGGYTGDGNIDVNPQFVKVITTGDEESDYHLADWSPAIGAGTATGAPTTDIEGNPRPNPAGSNPDMGAYENQYGTPQNSPPVIATQSDLTIAEDGTGTATLSATDIDGDAITYSAVSDTNAVTTSISASTLTLTPNANWNGVSNIKAYASDGTSKDSTSFKLTVTPVQDAPSAFEWVNVLDTIINITKTNLTDTYELEWTESEDVDGETIDYLLYAQIGVNPPEEVEEITDTTFQLIYEEILEHVFEPFPMLPRATVKFTVVATDGIETVKVTGDDRVVFVNRYEFLSTESEGIPTEFALHENYPNPFNPTTTLRFDLPEVSDITLTIYNMLGQKVRTFNYQNTSAGYHSVKWNATNDYGEQVGAGVYLYQLQTKDFVKTRKMVLLK